MTWNSGTMGDSAAYPPPDVPARRRRPHPAMQDRDGFYSQLWLTSRPPTLTSWPSLRTDLANAGATWVDEEVYVDHGLITSRRPGDLPAICATLVDEIADGGYAGSAT